MQPVAARARYLAAVLVIGLLAALLLAQAQSGMRCSIDEPGWIRSGYLSWRLATELAPPSRWTAAFSDPKLGPWGHQNPPVGKLIIGAATAAARQPGDPVQYMWRWPAGYLWNLSMGSLPPVELLVAVRGVIAWFGVACLVLVFLVARELTGRASWAALLAPLWLYGSYSFRYHATMVFTDVPQMAFTLLGLWLLLLWLRRARVGFLLGAGVAIGLACATKLSAGIVVVAAAAVAAAVPASRWRRVLHVVLAGGAPAAVFVAVNPHLWPRPLGNTLAMMRAWSSFIAFQQADPVNAPQAVTDRGHALWLTLSRVLLPVPEGGATLSAVSARVVVAVLVAVAVGALLAALVELARRTPNRRARAVALAVAAAAMVASWFVPTLAVAVAALVALGAWRLARGVREPAHARAAACFAAVYGATFVAGVWWLPFDWDRYYAPTLALTAVLVALGARGRAVVPAA